MPRFPLHPASGTGIYSDLEKKVIRLARYGCANRPFYHIVVTTPQSVKGDPPIEQVGTYDPMVNQYNEKLVTFNFERIQFWLGQGNVDISKSIKELLGIAGFFPMHPYTIMTAWSSRKKAEDEAKAKEEAEKNLEKAEQSN
ncbi:hypothetical protein PV325_003913 [Microctonus aethiopoides]|uniref:Small ribosomal subunit protein bS16m n=1 Tax=Microctonus aethiopoides TaxID=144406 RepID=A0AA39FNM2_9HYME|nr:hypothetical protein PV325_003913 [Microctonus aethiopoides]KAK0084774.1 hypothetical protein PV326_006157 [Microctonus aethiopoides]KAK0172950.1 hypothetical protein PV328_006209 [Microctonus aethiopoides]